MTSRDVVKRGQIWADCDPRQLGRTIRVDRHDHVQFGTNALAAKVPVVICTVLTSRDGGRHKAGRQVEIRVSRFRPYRNGYRLVSAPGAPS